MPPISVIWAWITCAAVTRVAAAIVLGDRFHFIDEAIYVDAARALLAGDGYGAGYVNVPAHPVWLAMLAAPQPASVMLLRCVHAIAVGVLGGIVIHAFGRRALGPEAAIVALALWALDPLMVVAGGLLYPDASAAVVLTAALLALVVAAQDDRGSAAAIAGFLLGLTVLFRPVAGVLLPVFVLWVASTTPAPLARRVRHGLVVLVACAVAVAPWVLTNLARDGRVIPAGMAGLQAAPLPRGAIGREGLATSMGRAVWRNPVRMVRHVGVELAHFWELYPTRLQTDDPAHRELLHRDDARLPAEPSFSPTLRDTVSAVTFGVELTLALAGLAIGWRTQRATVVLLTAVALAYGLGYALFVAKLRYRIVILPGVFLLAGFGAATLAARVRARQRGAEAVGG